MVFGVRNLDVFSAVRKEDVLRLMDDEMPPESYRSYATWGRKLRKRAISRIIDSELTEEDLHILVDRTLSLASKHLPEPSLEQLSHIVAGYRGMEKLIAEDPSFKMYPVSPFSFVDYFINKLKAFNLSPRIKNWAMDSIMIACYDIKSLIFRPSVVAFCAISEQIKNCESHKDMEALLLEDLDEDDRKLLMEEIGYCSTTVIFV